MFIAVDDKLCRPKLTEPLTSLLIADAKGDVREFAVQTCYKTLEGGKETELGYNLRMLFVWVCES